MMRTGDRVVIVDRDPERMEGTVARVMREKGIEAE
jgi:hypothetical protein